LPGEKQNKSKPFQKGRISTNDIFIPKRLQEGRISYNNIQARGSSDQRISASNISKKSQSKKTNKK